MQEHSGHYILGHFGDIIYGYRGGICGLGKIAGAKYIIFYLKIQVSPYLSSHGLYDNL